MGLKARGDFLYEMRGTMRDSDWEILDELNRNPNVSRAASVLYMSQPSLTKRLQRMEAELGVQIAERTPHGLEFTEEGRYLCQRAIEHLAFVEETQQHLESLKRSENHVINVGSSYTFNKYNLWDVLSGFGKLDDKARFNVINDQSDKLFKMLLDGKVDVAFVRGDYEGPTEKILVNRCCAYLVTKEPVALEKLPTMRRVDYKTSPFTTNLIENWWTTTFGGTLPHGMSVGYIGFAWEPIALNDDFYTLCFLPENFGNRYGLNLEPIYMPDGSPVMRNSWCMYQKEKLAPAHMGKFIDYIKSDIAIEPVTKLEAADE